MLTAGLTITELIDNAFETARLRFKDRISK